LTPTQKSNNVDGRHGSKPLARPLNSRWPSSIHCAGHCPVLGDIEVPQLHAQAPACTLNVERRTPARYAFPRAPESSVKCALKRRPRPRPRIPSHSVLHGRPRIGIWGFISFIKQPPRPGNPILISQKLPPCHQTRAERTAHRALLGRLLFQFSDLSPIFEIELIKLSFGKCYYSLLLTVLEEPLWIRVQVVRPVRCRAPKGHSVPPADARGTRRVPELRLRDLLRFAWQIHFIAWFGVRRRSIQYRPLSHLWIWR
jgi:hypothetical protein